MMATSRNTARHESRKKGDVSSDAKCEELTYSLIMRDKERLLSFDSKLKFIFSHRRCVKGGTTPMSSKFAR